MTDDMLKSWPERIYLQRDADCVIRGCGPHDETLWCADRINDGDVEYVRADLVAHSEELFGIIDRLQLQVYALTNANKSLADAAAGQPPNRHTPEPGLHHWWCETCQRQVESVEVTYDETHDLRAGGCGQHVFARPSQPPEHAPEFELSCAMCVHNNDLPGDDDWVCAECYRELVAERNEAAATVATWMESCTGKHGSQSLCVTGCSPQPPPDDLKEATRLLHIVYAWFWRSSDDPDSARVDPLYPARSTSSSKAPLFSAIRALLDRYPYGGATSTKEV